MTTSTWSFGLESPMKFEIPDKTAKLYNQAASEFFKAQERFKRKHNRVWDYSKDPIKISWSRRQRKAWNQFAKIFDEVNKTQGPFHVNDIMDDYLVKDVGLEMAQKVMKNSNRAISIACTAGGLYVLLRGLKRHA